MSWMISILHEARDPRDLNAGHALSDGLLVALAATSCGAKSCVEIAEYGQARPEELREIVPLRHGAPSHDTFSRVFRPLDPVEPGRRGSARDRRAPPTPRRRT